MKRFDYRGCVKYVVLISLLGFVLGSTTKFIIKFNSILTTTAIISTSLTFMISPVSNISPNSVEVEQTNISIGTATNYEVDVADTAEIESEIFVFENINDNLDFLSNNNIQENISPIVQLIRPDNAGDIIRKTYTAGTTTNFIPLTHGFINNATDVSYETILDTISQNPDMPILADGTPEVLIMHTHATETYLDAGQTEWYDLTYDGRTTDETKNVIRVGLEIAKQLENAGIGVIHDKTLHDYPSFNGAYDRSAVTVQEILDANPNIKIVLDVHRDAIVTDSTTITSPVTTINGKDAAQIMIISGCDNGIFNMPNYMENLKFSSALQQQMEELYPSLTRPILFDYRKYNQDLTTGSILLEMGGHANTLEEAIYSGELLGKALAELLLEWKV